MLSLSKALGYISSTTKNKNKNKMNVKSKKPILYKLSGFMCFVIAPENELRHKPSQISIWPKYMLSKKTQLQASPAHSM
jgi:hypothetical protein